MIRAELLAWMKAADEWMAAMDAWADAVSMDLAALPPRPERPTFPETGATSSTRDR